MDVRAVKGFLRLLIYIVKGNSEKIPSNRGDSNSNREDSNSNRGDTNSNRGDSNW